MLYYLFNYLDSIDFPGAGLFQFISFRAALALITSLIVSIVFGKRLINLLRRQQIGETVRDLGLAGQIEKIWNANHGWNNHLECYFHSNTFVCKIAQCVCNHDVVGNGLVRIDRVFR